jgi:hypothetical protein
MNAVTDRLLRHATATAVLLAAMAVPPMTALGQQGPSATSDASAAKPASPAAAVPRMPAAPKFRELPFEGEKPSAKDVLSRHVDAIGGAAAWDAKKSMTSTGAIEIPSVQIKGTIKMAAMAPDRVVVESELPGVGKTAQGFDGVVGWSIDPMRGPALMDPDQIAQIKRDGNFRKDLSLAQDPGNSEVVGLFDFEGTPCWQVKVDGVGGGQASQFYARDTGLLRGMSMSAATPMGELPIVMVMDEYREFGDVKMSARSTTKVMGQTQLMTIDSVTWNAASEADFALPAQIKALVSASSAGPAANSPAGASPPASSPPASGGSK